MASGFCLEHFGQRKEDGHSRRHSRPFFLLKENEYQPFLCAAYMSDPFSILRECIAEYTRFNAARSLSCGQPSEFQLHRFGEAIAMLDPERPGSWMYNRVLGFCENSVPQVRDIFALYKKAGEPCRFDIDADKLFPEVIEPLVKRGLGATKALTYFSAKPKMPKANLRRTGVAFERWEPDRADDFLELLKSSGVICEPEVWKDRREYYCTDTFRTVVASCDGHPCSWATMFVDGEYGYLANAYTMPEFRNRGCHSVLLRARMADAKELGLQRIFTDVIGDSQSHQNCKRAGFKDLTVMTLWADEC